MSIITLTERALGSDGVFEVAVRFEDGGEHVVRVADPLAGNPDGERLLAWYFEEHLRYPFLDSDLEREAVALLAGYGKELFEQVFGEDRDCSYEFRRVRDAGFDGWRLEVVGGMEFHRLHWEALRDGGAGAPFGVRVPVVRRVENVDRGFDVEAKSPTLNVLVVTARPGGARDVGYRTISRPLLAALRQASVPVLVDLVRPGSWRALETHLQAVKSQKGSGWYGIVHFDVHGAVARPDELRQHVGDDYLLTEDARPENDDGGAYLFFEASEGDIPEPVSTARVADLLVEHRVPVAVLNACQSAMQSRGSEASLAQRLVEAGVPVSVGMGYSVTVTAAELMMPVIYKQLAGGAEILSAIHAGRRELFDVRARRAYFDQSLDLEDWVLPVVFSQRPVELRPRAATPEQIQQFYSRRAHLVEEPKPQYGFVGRDLDVQAIERMLLGDDAQNELLVMGMAGAGKSTLLAHLGWWWQETGLVDRVLSFSYEDRAWTVDQILEELISELLDGHEQALARALTGDAQLERVATLLRAGRHLLVLDNAESITATPASIPHSLPEAEQLRLRRFLSRLRGGKSLVLLGSRGPEAWLAADAFAANVYELGGLDPQATSILVERIITRHGGRLPDSDIERDALDELIGILGGYPLALTVVLPVVAATAPSDVLAEIKRGGEDADPGSIIQHAVELSHGRLDPATQNSLILLAPFTSVVPTGGLNLYLQLLETHEPVKELGPLDLPGALNEAIKVGLATSDTQSQTHARLQPLLPYFLRTRLIDHPNLAAAVAQAHHDLYQQLGPSLHALLISRNPDERAAGRSLTYAEYANLTTALDYALAHDHPATPFIKPLEEFLDQARQQHARRQLLDLVIQAISQPGPADRRTELAQMHNLAGITALEQHHLDDAHTHHQAELALYQQLGDRHSSAVTYHQLGIVAQRQRRFEEAEAHYKKALEIKLEFNDRHSSANTYGQLGTLAQNQRRFEEAEAYYKKALEIELEFNDRHTTAVTYHQLGILAQNQRRFEEAEAYYKKALEIELEFNDRHSSANTYGQLGILAQEQRRFEEAEAYYKKALEGELEFNDRHSTAITYHQLGMIAQEQRRFEEAEAYYKKALEIELEFNDRHRMASTYHQLGTIAQNQLRFEEAEAYYKKALEIELEFNDHHSAASTYHQLGMIAQNQLRFEEAEAYYKKALEIKLEFNDHHNAASTYHQLGMIAQEQLRFEEAEAYYKKALEIKLELDDRHSAASTQSELGILVTRMGRISDAIQFSLDALVSRAETTGQWSRLDLQWLKRQRGLTGVEPFRAAVVRHLNDGFLEQLLPLLDQVDEPPE